MQRSFPGINPSISEWKGQEITDFQEELLGKVNAHISEKWFYTHMKSLSKSLPRIDVLNLLSKYAGYANWDDFVFRHKKDFPSEVLSDRPVKAKSNPNAYFYTIPLLAIVIVAIFFGIFKLFNTHQYRFYLHDADTRAPITKMQIAVRLLPDGETPVDLLCDSSGSFSLKTDKSIIRMVVSNPYYQSDTITQILRKLDHDEIINLHANDFALMIHYFSQTNVADWEKRREKLERMIEDSALICQVLSTKETAGMELLTKEEFINKLTMPSGSLKNLEILDTKYRHERISVLRFRVNSATR